MILSADCVSRENMTLGLHCVNAVPWENISPPFIFCILSYYNPHIFYILVFSFVNSRNQCIIVALKKTYVNNKYVFSSQILSNISLLHLH